MGNKHKEENISLEALIRLKRNERPSTDFWQAFESDFERRRLHALVERDTTRHSIWIPALKAAMIGLPALVLVSLGTFWIQNGLVEKPELRKMEAASPPILAVNNFEPAKAASAESVSSQQEWPTGENERLLSQFVVDAITSEPERAMNFRKVLYTPALHLSGPTGASYVRDSLSSRNYEVTTANSKLGRNF